MASDGLATAASSSSASSEAEGPTALNDLLAMLGNGAEEYHPLWQKHDTFRRGGLTAPQFAAFWQAFCECEGLVVDEADGHATFRALDPDGSGFLRWTEVVGGPRDPQSTRSGSFRCWMMRKGRRFLGDPNKSAAAQLPTVEWAPFPEDGAGYGFCPRAALAVWHVGTTVAHHLFFHKPYQPPFNAALLSCLHSYPSMLDFGSRKNLKEDSTFIGVALETPFAFVLFLRGTCLVSEVFADMKVTLKSCPGLPGAVHSGFYAVYTRGPCLRLQIKQALESFVARDPRKPIVLGGHSLGAGLASMATYEALSWVPSACHRLLLLTFGSPKVGNKTWAETFNRDVQQAGAVAWRVANSCDPVTRLGFRPLFHHCGEAREFRLRLASPVGAQWLRNHVEAYPAWLQGGATPGASPGAASGGDSTKEAAEDTGIRTAGRKVGPWRRLTLRK
eukprot:GGOE01046784.1.p1 GENE.GGOE01046784.1~~GGOE01046784.1.p1  ORF type:complete len:462 (+),score=103.19 GGOE01046784.1:50-1387(+)